MIELIGTWVVFAIALTLTMTILIELFNEARNCYMVVGDTTIISTSFNKISYLRLSIIAFFWGLFGFLLML